MASAAVVFLASASVAQMSAQDATKTATAEKAAEARVQTPAQGGRTFLEIGVSNFKPPSVGAVGFAVTVADRSGAEQEVGRFSMFPVAPFTARNALEERTFSFDVSAALATVKSDGPLTVRIKVVPEAGQSAAGAALTIGHVELGPR